MGPRYIIRDAETGNCPLSIPEYRTYATEAGARRAAQRAADRYGRPMAYGMPKAFGLCTIKHERGVCYPRGEA